MKKILVSRRVNLSESFDPIVFSILFNKFNKDYSKLQKRRVKIKLQSSYASASGTSIIFLLLVLNCRGKMVTSCPKISSR